MRRYKYSKTYTWSRSLAYLTGVIAADGCLINNGRHLNITSTDTQIIETAQNILGMNVKVGIKLNRWNKTAYSLQFSNVALYDFLLHAGLTPAKSKTMRNLAIPENYYADFLRGYFDGDGTIHGYWDKRWKNSYMYYSSYASASYEFLKWLQTMNSLYALTSPGKIKPGARVLNLTYAKKDSKKLFYFMYYNQNLPMLSRKYEKFIAFLETDPYGNKEPHARVLELVDRPR